MEDKILDANSFDNNNLSIDNQAQNFLQKIAFWAKLIGIVSIVIGTIIILGAFFVKSIFSALGLPSDDSLFISIFLVLLYSLFGFILIFPGYKLLQFASKMKTALISTNKVLLNDSIDNLLAVFRFYGIITMIFLGFYALTFILAFISIFTL